MSTAHINAQSGYFAETVLLPGDPLRAKFIAEKYLKSFKEVTNVRNMLGFTGEYQGKRISVMGSGMGVPSASIYATELIKNYGVKNIIRVGSAGGLKGSNLNDIILASGASTNSSVNRQRLSGYDFAAVPDFYLLNKAYNAALANNIGVKVGNCFTTDLFYNPNLNFSSLLEKMNILCVEMEAAGLYGLAHEHGAKALTILTISDLFNSKEELSAKERENTFFHATEIALSCAI
ncbi:Purine nucleoside phosphorylase DeoD [Candidatus Hepatincolaceae symbiont of Richtersius coronifer]